MEVCAENRWSGHRTKKSKQIKTKFEVRKGK
jgi:hypothetical protein